MTDRSKYLHFHHFFSREIPETTGSELNMSTSKKHQTFCSQSMAGKPVTALPGIGKANGGRLQGHGTGSATQVLGRYLVNEGNQSQFQSWLKENSGANSKHSADCYNGVREWSNNNL
ncbi:barrier-to-autointegration factor-like isoform X2 [Colossoma macropomum]|uniref:barrier-to-autointegration factor-like isoform X2 n=1 Tax=Colossoma macropomum TaxID=42526 RepID=UPI001863A897|nr:barrier-to-autointegration factor-like isoform X2 [Colossoma macropomum]